MKKLLLMVSLFCCYYSSYSQQAPYDVEEQEERQGLSPYFKVGQVALTTDLESFYLNFGGPGIQLAIGDVNVSFNMFPSLRASSERIMPTLGAGFQVIYRNFIVSAPFYYIDQNWRLSAGVGYRLAN